MRSGRPSKVGRRRKHLRPSECGFLKSPRRGPQKFVAEIIRDESISEHSGSITTERMEKTSRDKNLENQCESSKSAIFSWYFNALSRWCQKRHHIRTNFLRLIRWLGIRPSPKSPQKALKSRLMHWFDAFLRTQNTQLFSFGIVDASPQKRSANHLRKAIRSRFYPSFTFPSIAG